MIAKKLTSALFTSTVVILLFALMAPYALDGVKINLVSGYFVKVLGYVMVLTLYVVPVVAIYGTIAAVISERVVMLINSSKSLLYMACLYALFGLLFGVVYLLLFGDNTLISVVIIIPISIAMLFLAIERMIMRRFSDRKLVRIALVSSVVTVVLLFVVSLGIIFFSRFIE